MSDTITPEQFSQFLELAPTNVLQQSVAGVVSVLRDLQEDAPECEIVSMMYFMHMRELDLREVEPLWRKARRFAVRNSQTFKQVGKIAACIGAGVLLGVSLDD